MLFSTPTQFAALLLTLIAGWLLGLASHPGGRKWKARYSAERDAHAAARKDGDIRAVAAEQRVTELERENARLTQATPVATPVTTPVATRTATPVAAHPSAMAAARPAYPVGERRGWFDFDRTPLR